MVYSIDTAPDDGFLSSVVPVYPAEYLATFTAAYPLGKTMVAAVIMAQLSRQKSKDFIMNIKPWHSLSALLDSTA